MQSKDIILQVSEETAEVMEEISEQLFDESEARFDEIVEAIEESVKKIEKLYADYSGKADTQLSSSKSEILSRFDAVLETLTDFKTTTDEQFVGVESKSNRLIEIMSDVPQLIQAVAKDVSEASESRKEFESSLLHTIKGLAENLIEIQKVQSGIVDTLRADDCSEKLTSTLNKLSEIEKNILFTKEAIGGVSETLHTCNTLIEGILSSVKDLQTNDEKILDVSGKQIQKIDELQKLKEEQSRVALEKIGEVLTCLGSLASTIQAISDKQNELCEKQEQLEKDVKYLKLPFFKRWFTKG